MIIMMIMFRIMTMKFQGKCGDMVDSVVDDDAYDDQDDDGHNYDNPGQLL